MPTEVGRFGVSWMGDTTFGVGAGANFTVTTIGLRYWFKPRWGFEVGTGLTVMQDPNNPGTTDGCWAVAGAGLMSLARYKYVNVYGAGRAMFIPVCLPQGGAGPTIVQVGLSGEIAAEIFLDALTLFGPSVFQTSHSISVTIATGLGFHFTAEFMNGAGTSSATLATSSAKDSISAFTGAPNGSVAITYYF